MKKRIIIKEEDYDFEKQGEWEKTVKVLKWEHDFVEKIYIIDYEEITDL